MRLPYNYKWFNGAVLCDSWTDTYNLYNDDSDFELENRHRFLIMCFELMGYMDANNKGKK